MSKLNVVIHNVLYDEKEKDSVQSSVRAVEFDDNTTLQDMIGAADVSSYYPLSGAYSFNNEYVPYIISENTVLWNVDYSDVRVKDFIATHHIQNHTLAASEGHTKAGGPGFTELSEVWNQIYPIIDQFVTTVGIVPIVFGAGRWIASLFHKKEVPPQSYFDLIYSRDRWNHFELADLLCITSDDSKRLLNSLAYQYDPSVLMFVQQPESLELKDKLTKVNVYDK